MGRAWSTVEEQRFVSVPDQNETFFLYTALSSDRGKNLPDTHLKGNTHYLDAFLKPILTKISGRVLLV